MESYIQESSSKKRLARPSTTRHKNRISSLHAYKSLDELRRDLAEVNRMIRVLEWVSLQPKA